MAVINIKRPADLLGRSVCGAYRLGTDEFTFAGIVEAVVLPAPGSRFGVEFFVCDEYVSLSDCIKLDYAPAPVPAM
jgi:hypothetical protein